jgi:hypothetical protein
MDTVTRTAPNCPPHYWQVAEARRVQHWTCYRCGAEQERSRGTWSSTAWRRIRAARSPPGPRIPPGQWPTGGGVVTTDGGYADRHGPKGDGVATVAGDGDQRHHRTGD